MNAVVFALLCANLSQIHCSKNLQLSPVPIFISTFLPYLVLEVGTCQLFFHVIKYASWTVQVGTCQLVALNMATGHDRARLYYAVYTYIRWPVTSLAGYVSQK